MSGRIEVSNQSTRNDLTLSTHDLLCSDKHKLCLDMFGSRNILSYLIIISHNIPHLSSICYWWGISIHHWQTDLSVHLIGASEITNILHLMQTIWLDTKRLFYRRF